MYRHFFKRLIDFLLALVGLICVSPILIVVTILLHFANKGAGAFFLQERPGLNGKIFKVIKFKTMTDECDAYGNLLKQTGDTDNDYLYTGEQYNETTGLYYLRARYLSVKQRIESGGFCELFSAISPLRPRGHVCDGTISAEIRRIFRGFIFGEEIPLSR